MSSTALTIIAQPDVAHSFEAMRAHLAVKSLGQPLPITEEPSVASRLILASLHLGCAITFATDAGRSVLLRLSRPWPLVGLSGCAFTIIFTALSIWR